MRFRDSEIHCSVRVRSLRSRGNALLIPLFAAAHADVWNLRRSELSPSVIDMIRGSM